MTDRIKGFTITLDRSFREDELDAVKVALLMTKGVVSVDPLVEAPGDFVVTQRERNRLLSSLTSWMEDKR